MNIVFVLLICIFSLLGGVIGYIKGFGKIGVWGGVILSVFLLETLIGGAVVKNTVTAVVMLILTSVFALVFILLYTWLRSSMQKKIKRADEVTAAYNEIPRSEMEQKYSGALENSSKKVRKMFRNSAKAESVKAPKVFNRILGAVAGALNEFVVCSVIILLILFFVDFAHLDALDGLFGAATGSKVWTESGAKWGLDLLLVTLICLCFYAGYRSGIAVAVGALLCFGLVGLSGYLSYHFVFDLGALTGAMGNSIISKVLAMSVLFILMLVPTVVITLFLPKLIVKLRDNKVFEVVDGAFGLVIFSVVVIAVFLFAGGIAYMFNSVDIFAKFNSYAGGAPFASCFYSYNPINGLIDSLPLRGWFGL